MSSSTVYQALQSAITPEGAIDLWAAANGDAALAGLVPVLRLFGISSAYILEAATLARGPNDATVTLTGNGSFSQPGATDPANIFRVFGTMVYTQQGDIFQFSLRVTDPPWTFSGFFLVLPDTFMTVPDLDPGVLWYPSFLKDMRIDSPVFSAQNPAPIGSEASLRLSGFLPEPADPRIPGMLPMIGPWPLRLEGTLTMPADAESFPVFRLEAKGSADSILDGRAEKGVQGPQSMVLGNLGLTLISERLDPPQPDRDAFTTLELFGTLSLGDFTGRVSTYILSVGTTWNFGVRFDGKATLVQGLAQLTKLFGVELPIPMNFPLLSDFYFSELDLDLLNTTPDRTYPTFSLKSFAITIRSDKTWTPPIPFLALENVGTRWLWSWTYATDPGTNATSMTYLLTGSVFGTFLFGEGGSANALSSAPPPPPPGGGGAALPVSAQAGPVHIDVSLSLPDFLINGDMQEDDYIPIGEALAYFFGSPGPSTGPQAMNVTRFGFSADPIGQNYYANAAIFFGDPENPDPQQGWEIDLIVLKILVQELEFFIATNNGKVSGGMSGAFFLVQGDPADYALPRIELTAEYPEQDPDAPQGWTLGGQLYPGTSIDLTLLVYQFIYGGKSEVPSWVPTLTVDSLYFACTTGSTGTSARPPSYVLGGAISALWQPAIFHNDLKVSASVSLDMAKDSSSDAATGRMTGFFSVNKLALEASLAFGVPEATYMFKVQFDEIWMQATTSWRGEEGKGSGRHQVVSLQLGGITLGEVLEYLVNLAAPTLGFRLDPPWDVLKQIDLSRFVLTIDPEDNVVEFVFNAHVDLAVMQLDSIGVSYAKVNGESRVELMLTGEFLGKKYGSDDPLSWDVINDPPPSVPGQGGSLVRLRYLGLGQRVTFKVPDSRRLPDTVAESVALLRASMRPATDPDQSPLAGQDMRFSADSQWLIGLDVGLMETVDLGLIFNDPRLYGLSIALGGAKAGSLAGLRFEILYKKITNDIGMFRVELRVPDAFRTFQLGAVTVTLGIIVVEIYTNGNFKVDLGFPYNRDYSRSFSLQAAIFIGRGGFYFGVLDGDTSTQVPRITNGNFSPVLELGVGLAAGVGREINAGILKGGIYVEIEVLFQGVLAWFNPNSKGTAAAKYFACRGVVAIHGKLYGSVDFAVIKVSLTLEAYAQASVAFESYKPTVFDLSVGVTARAKVKFLFFSVSFSFHVTLDVSFSIGKKENTPWILAADSPSSGTGGLLTAGYAYPWAGGTRKQPRLAARTDPARRKRVLREEHLRALRRRRRTADAPASLSAPGEESAYTLAWSPSTRYFPDSPRNAHVTLVPLFTVGDVPVNWSDVVPANADPRYRAAFVLCADTGVSPAADTLADTARRSAALSAMGGLNGDSDDTSRLAADIFAQGLALYALNAVPREASQGDLITAGQLSLLIDEMKLPQTFADGFSLASLRAFFETNITWLVSGDPEVHPDTKGAMSIPMPPFLSWTSPQAGTVDFADKNPIGSLYEWGIARLLAPYSPVGVEPGPAPATDDPSLYESFAGFMFRDFCLMMAQNAVQEAQKLMDNATVTVGADADNRVQSLGEVAVGLPQATVTYVICSGNTMDSVAADLGATVAELEFLNPTLPVDIQGDVGTVLPVILGIAPEVLAADNADRPFVSGQWDLGTVFHQIAAQTTLSQVADLFQIADPAALLGYDDGGTQRNLNNDANLLLPGAAFDLPGRTFADAPADFDQARAAAAFYTRYRSPELQDEPSSPDLAAWYAGAIAALNPGKLDEISMGGKDWTLIELAPGQILTVPNYYQAAYSGADATNPYTTINGDNLLRIGTTLALQQDFTTTAPSHAPDWPVFRDATTAQGDDSWGIPAAEGVLVQAGENTETLVRRLILDAVWTAADEEKEEPGEWTYDWGAVYAWMGDAPILAPLAVVTVPGARTAEGVFCFNDLAQIYGLPIATAAGKLKDVHGLFAQGTVLQVSHLPAQSMAVLADAVLQGESFAGIVNQSSRMLMAGLRLPALKTNAEGHTAPDPDTSLPLYDLTGQQIDLEVDPAAPDATALELAVSSQAGWIQLMHSLTVPAGTTSDEMQALETEYFDLARYNPGIATMAYPLAGSLVLITKLVDPIEVPAGTTEAEMLQLEERYPYLLECNPRIAGFAYPLAQNETLLTNTMGNGLTLDYAYTNGQIEEQGPQTGLAAMPSAALSPNPQAMPFSGIAPRTYGFENRIALQSAVALAIPPDPDAPAVISGTASLWPFPEAFLRRAKEQAGAAEKTPYEILNTSQAGAAGRHADALPGCTFGMALPFRIHRLDAGTTRFDLLGVDTDARALLLALIQELEENAAAEAGSCAYLLAPPAPNASYADGLTVLDSPASGTYLIKTNLSTESVPEPPEASRRAAAEDAAPLYFSTLAPDGLADFLRLLWEGSVVGGTGYYFGTGTDVPPGAFDSQGNATLQLLVIVKSQQQAATEGRILLPCNNCLLMAPGLDASVHSLFAESYDDSQDNVVNALLPPGNAGFRIAVDRPMDAADPDLEKEAMLRNLYSLLCFEIVPAEDSSFEAPPSGLPVPPLPWDGSPDTPSQREKRLRRKRQAVRKSRNRASAVPPEAAADEDPSPYWRYDQVIPLYNFTQEDVPEAAPLVAGLPPPAGDPYRGLGMRSTMPTVGFRFAFGDLLGNRSAAMPDCAIPGFTVGYTDNLIGINQWPAVAYTYEVALDGLSDDAPVSLIALLSARPSALLPDPTQGGSVSSAPADQQAQRYAQSYYQLAQSGIQAFLVTTLKKNPAAADRDAGWPVADINPLIHFAGGAYAHARTVLAMTAALPKGAATLSDVVRLFGVGYMEIALANADSLMEDLFGPAPLAVPAYLPFVEHDSIDVLCERTPAGWPDPTAGELLALPQNAARPLKVGTALTIDPPASVPTGDAPTPSISALAAQAKTSISLLADDNAFTGHLDPDFVFTVSIGDGKTATVPADPEAPCPPFLDDVRLAFAEQGVNLLVGDIVAANADLPGMFQAGQNLASSSYLVVAGDTLAANGSGRALADLIEANTGTLDLFDAGALIYFGDFAGVSYGDAPPTLRQFADRFACPMDLLLSGNPDAALPAAGSLVVPGMLSWPADLTGLRIPYTIRAEDTLTLISGRFSSPGGAGGGSGYLLAQANVNVPCIFAPGATIDLTVDGQTTAVVATPSDSFASLIARVPGADLEDLVTSITDTPGVLRTGGMLLCAPALLPQACAPQDIQALYTVDAAGFALANAATPDLIAGGRTLYSTDGAVSVLTQDGDTFNSLIVRFAEGGAHMDAGQIATASSNRDVVFLKAMVPALLAPASLALSVEIVAEGAYPKTTGPYPAPVFPLEVTLRLTRPATLIAPEFKTPDGSGPVEAADSFLPAPAKDKDGDSDTGLTFDRFISLLAEALPTLRIGTAKLDGESTDLWCADFNPSNTDTGIASVALKGPTTISIDGEETAQPRYFGLEPLYDHLVTRTDVPIRPLEADGTLGAAVPVNYQGIDVELWAQRFLSDLDRFLSGSYASALYEDPDLRTYLSAVLAGKGALIPEIAAGLGYVLDLDDGPAPLQSAQAAFEQRLGVGLARAYATSVLLQYDAAVSSPWQSASPLGASPLGASPLGASPTLSAKLFGEPAIAGASAAVTLAAAKTDLSVAESYVNMSMTVGDAAHNAEVTGSLAYGISHLEFNISDAGMPEDYVASDWLTFVPLLAGDEKPSALAETDPGPLNAPVFLRVFPALPAIQGQTAVAAYSAPEAELAQYSLWTYGITYAHEHAEQDYVQIAAEFNLMPKTQGLRAEEPRDLFTELAQYTAVADSMWNLLGGLADAAAQADPIVLANAVAAYADLVGRVAAYWPARIAQEQTAAESDDLLAQYIYSFDARAEYSKGDGAPELVSYTLRMSAGQTSPGPNGTWPSVAYVGPDGTAIGLTAGAESGGKVAYTVPDGVSIPAIAWPAFRIEWNSLNVSAIQNARIRLSVERNQNLIRGSDIATNPAFLFKTSEVVANSVATPLLNWNEPQPITGSDAGAALQQALETLFPAGDPPVAPKLPALYATFGIAYAYEIVVDVADPGNRLTSKMPVALYPNQLITDTLGAEVQAAIAAWESKVNPNRTGGEWAFSLTLYSAEETSLRPILVIDELYFRISPEERDIRFFT